MGFPIKAGGGAAVEGQTKYSANYAIAKTDEGISAGVWRDLRQDITVVQEKVTPELTSNGMRAEVKGKYFIGAMGGFRSLTDNITPEIGFRFLVNGIITHTAPVCEMYLTEATTPVLMAHYEDDLSIDDLVTAEVVSSQSETAVVGSFGVEEGSHLWLVRIGRYG